MEDELEKSVTPDAKPSPASWLRRLLAQVIDLVVCVIVFTVLIGGGMELVEHATGRPCPVPTVLSNEASQKHSECLRAEEKKGLRLSAFAFSAIGLIYYSIFESSRLQGTLGKLALRIRVTDLSGRRISWMRALGRNAAKAISSVLGLGFLMQPFTARRQALHDIMADCLVVTR